MSIHFTKKKKPQKQKQNFLNFHNNNNVAKKLSFL